MKTLLLDGLNIPEYYCLDIEPLHLLRALEECSIDRMETDLVDYALHELEKQIERNNTFFIDIEKLGETQAAILVNRIIDARRSEIETLTRKEITLDLLASTYYGFNLLTSKVRQKNWKSHAIEFFDFLEADVAANRIELDGEVLPERVSFINCLPNTRRVLREILYLTGSNSGLRAEAANTLGSIGDRRSEPYLRRAASDEYPWVRQACARGLGIIAHKNSIPFLIHLLDDFDTTVQNEAVTGLAAIGSASVPYLIEKLETEDSGDFFQQAMKSIGTSHPRSIDSFASAISQQNTNTKTLAIEALSLIADKRAVPILEKMKLNESDLIRQRAISALDRITAKDSQAQPTRM
ncbi:MAG: HEAT repeat domain-containing protein [Candidatus Thorarchaeota archaeon]